MTLGLASGNDGRVRLGKRVDGAKGAAARPLRAGTASRRARRLTGPLSRARSRVDRAAPAQRWELENRIEAIDSIYNYDAPQDARWKAEKPWATDPRYFKHVRVSALALIKMVMHARSGGSLEVIGIMQGKMDPNDRRGPTLIVMDVFALPVEGTETRVNPMVGRTYHLRALRTRDCAAGCSRRRTRRAAAVGRRRSCRDARRRTHTSTWSISTSTRRRSGGTRT